MDEQYTYTQLDASETDSFRILKLQPGGKDAPIVCGLVHARLDDEPPYEAISYVWGSTENPIPIECDGKRLYIIENLKDALVRVRLPDRPRCVWADYVCIDQDNLEEKERQVQLMGEIYSNASGVLICLGNDDEGHAQKAMSLVQDLSNMITETLPECEQTHESFPHLSPDDPWLYDDRWDTWTSLFSRPWFGRGWVVQEAALAQDAVVLWGEAECSWVPLMDCATWFPARGPISHRKGSAPMVHMFLHQSISSHSRRLRPLLWPHKDSENRGVLELMQAARRLSLSKPVDRVFAFLAVIDKFSPSALNIKVDYSKAPHSVYTEFAAAYLQATRDLDLLHWVQHTDESLELGTPSWVPLWDLDEWSITQNPGYHDVMSQQVSAAHFTVEQESGTLKLTVQAVLFDNFRFVSDPLLIETVEDVCQLWQVIRHTDELADVHEFLQAMCSGRATGDWEAWDLQTDAYGRHLLDSSSSSNFGMKTFGVPMTLNMNYLLTKQKKNRTFHLYKHSFGHSLKAGDL